MYYGRRTTRERLRMKFDVVLLFEHTGLAAKPFIQRGMNVCMIDLQNTQPNAYVPEAAQYAYDVLKRERDIVKLCRGANLVFGMPPCTDLAVSGARHFRKKAALDSEFQTKAVHLARSVERIGTKAGAPWAAENPIGRLSTLWRHWNFIFDPWEFGAYLPLKDGHPMWPEYIPARDAYSKRTCLWSGNGFKLPRKRPVEEPDGYSPQFYKTGGKSEKTKLIRSASPRGFFTALAKSL